jgi:hypothetical protein
MKTVSDYLATLTEDGEATPTNTSSSGAIATREVPLGTVVKHKTLEDIQAPDGDGVTNADSDAEKKRMFRAKQAQNSDSTMSFA